MGFWKEYIRVLWEEEVTRLSESVREIHLRSDGIEVTTEAGWLVGRVPATAQYEKSWGKRTGWIKVNPALEEDSPND